MIRLNVLRSALVVLSALGFSLPSSAALIDNGSSMFDTATNLEWLDLTETQGLSVNQVNASAFVTVDGYVHATDEQVQSLFLSSAGFATGASVQNVSNDPAAALLLSFLGCTQFCGVADLNGTGRGFADWNDAGTYTRALYKEGPLGGSWATTSGLTADLDLADPTAGHFLVRVIPEPGTVTLLGLGLVGLAARRRIR